MTWCRDGLFGAPGGVALGVLLSLCAADVRATEGAGAPEASVLSPPSKEDLAKARLHYDSGAVLYEAGKYAASRDAFEESYRLSRLPDLLFNLAAVAKKLARPADAQRYLEQYLEMRPAAPDRVKVQAEIEEYKAEIKKQEDAEMRALLLAEPPPAPLLQEPTRRLPPWPALALSGGGVALLIVGFACGGAALSAAGQIDSGTTFDKGLYDRGVALDRTAIAFDVLGGLALAGGVAWTAVWWLKGRGRTENQALRLVPQGAGLGLQGRF